MTLEEENQTRNREAGDSEPGHAKIGEGTDSAEKDHREEDRSREG